MFTDEVFTDEAMKFMDRFNHEGGPVLPVDPDALKRIWPAIRKAEALAKPHTTTGLGAVAGPSLEMAQPESGAAWLSLVLRGRLLSSLEARDVLREHVVDENLNDDVFRAAATMPLDKEDLAEAMILLHLAQSPEDVRSKTKQQLKAEGYDPDSPNIDSKFLRCITSQGTQ
jgi:hypothetical protein